MKSSGFDIMTRVESILKDKNIRKGELGDYLGVSLQLLRDWKNRKNVPPADIIFNIAEFLEVSQIYLLTGETNPDTPQAVIDLAYEIMALHPDDQDEIKKIVSIKKEKYIKRVSEKLSNAD